MLLTSSPEAFGGEWTCTNWDLLEKTAKTAYYVERLFQQLITHVPAP